MAIIASDPASPINLQRMIARIDERLDALNLSDRRASIAATGLPDAIREIRRGKVPSDARIRQLAQALEVSPDYLAGFSDSAAAPANDKPSESGRRTIPLLPRDVPVYGADSGLIGVTADDPDSSFIRYGFDLTSPIDFATRTPKIWVRDDVFAIHQRGPEMDPRYAEGGLLYIDPRRRPAPGEGAFVTFESPYEGMSPSALKQLDKEMPHLADTTWGLVAEWAGRGENSEFVLKQFNPLCTLSLGSERVKGIYRIIPYEELLQ